MIVFYSLQNKVKERKNNSINIINKSNVIKIDELFEGSQLNSLKS
jgi:hypothetical protein